MRYRYRWDLEPPHGTRPEEWLPRIITAMQKRERVYMLAARALQRGYHRAAAEHEGLLSMLVHPPESPLLAPARADRWKAVFRDAGLTRRMSRPPWIGIIAWRRRPQRTRGNRRSWPRMR